MNEYIKRRAWIETTLLGCLMLAPPAQAASFDCAKAQSKVEKLICADASITKLDEELNAAYNAALQDEKQVDSIRQTQKQWMKERNNCFDAACVKQAYEDRLKALGMSDRSADFDKVKKIAPHIQANKTKSAGQAFPRMPPKLHYAFCDKNKPGLYCLGQTGKGYSICEAYFKYIQVLAIPPTCEAPIPPGFKQPNWEELDIMQHLDLAYQAEGFFLKKWGNYKHPDFDTWRQTFLQAIQDGKISPRMRKTRVTPYDKGEATILAYTRDRDACHKAYEWEKRRKVQLDKLPADTPAWRRAELVPGYPYPGWNNQGDVHFTLTDDTPSKLQVIVGDVSSFQMELLLYAGRAYLVRVSDPFAPIYRPRGGNPYREMDNSAIAIYAFDPRFPDLRPQLDLNHYMAEPRCQFLPY
ncbi:lysozyme inhibitor LprI family protein [Methylobacter sp.]|uniref:lysozyme inhibitor LprI family protein n=1 Tax=Methylobacter sp. TaxID=2051955 RepID=UPI002487D5A5|nr:lysozyme inhibitor LprI family protein [Methylobacter sp.]MDI1279665.1 lysozyme inhibitor LprI family protein [Methylobacter sp.]MDI1360360.1 lysozyme inhibitor LprI family protein [Methylobacter sp.]